MKQSVDELNRLKVAINKAATGNTESNTDKLEDGSEDE
jgi:hypothetical protein